MPVYVDDMHRTRMGQLGRMKMSHMIADTRDELLTMAVNIGLKPEWLQSIDTPREHFDVSLSRRAKAVELGAREISMKDLARITRARSQAGREGFDAYTSHNRKKG